MSSDVGSDAGAPSLGERAYTEIEELIITLKLAPGSALSETELAQRLGIGRTPVREALQRLARERLVMVLPRRGVVVSEINVASQLRLLEVRRELERLIARSAARRASDEQRERLRGIAAGFEAAASADDGIAFMRIDREFNLLCSSASGNEFAANAMSLMHGLSRRFWYLHHAHAADMPRTAKLHAAIARAIAKADEDRAGAASDRLLDLIERFTRSTLQS